MAFTIDSVQIDDRYLGFARYVPMDANQLGLVMQETTIRGSRFPIRRISTTERFGNQYISGSRANEIPFQYIEKVPVWSKTANYNDIGDIMGRYESISVYTNSNAQDISLTLIYIAEGDSDNPNHSTPWTLQATEFFKKKLQALTYPDYAPRYSAPPRVLLNIGNIFQRVPVTIRSISIDEGEGPFYKNMYSGTKKITLEMKTSYPLYQAVTYSKVANTFGGNPQSFV